MVLSTGNGAFHLQKEDVMKTRSSFPEQGERVIVTQKGITTGDFIGAGVILVFVSGIVSFGVFLSSLSGYDPSMWYFYVAFLVLGPLLWIYILVSYIIRAVYESRTLTDRRIILIDKPWARTEIPLIDIESMQNIGKRQIEIKRRSLYSQKTYIVKDACAFVEAYHNLMKDNPNR
jgi:hypothetical protein